MKETQYTIVACLINALENALDNESPKRIRDLSKAIVFITESPNVIHESIKENI